MLNTVYVLAISEKEIFRFKYTEYKISERFSRKFEAGVTKKGKLNWIRILIWVIPVYLCKKDAASPLKDLNFLEKCVINLTHLARVKRQIRYFYNHDHNFLNPLSFDKNMRLLTLSMFRMFILNVLKVKSYFDIL